MKLKGISLIEQHVEKTVLGVVVLGFFGVLAWQFIGRPNQVDMGSMQGVEPSRVDGILKERAEAVAQQLKDDVRPDPDPFARALPKVSDQFAAAIREGTRGPEALPRIASAMARDLQPIDLGAETAYHVPSIPTPTMVASVMQTADALEDGALSRHPELAARFPDPAAPKDIVWTTPTATIHPAEILAELRRSATSATPPQAQLPTPWFNDALYVVDVLFTREEQLPDGTWGKPSEVNPIPGQTSFRVRLGKDADAKLRDEIFTSLGDRATQQALLQPEFLATRNNAFVPPAIVEEGPASAGDEQVDQLVDRIRLLKADRDSRTQQLAELGGPLDDAPRQRDRDKDDEAGGGGAAPPGGGGLGGGQSGTRGNRGNAEDEEKNRVKRINLTRALRQLEDRIEAFEAELKRISPEATVAAGKAGGIDFAGDQPVLVWAHDIDVKPGSTYRYRAQLRVYNPFFTRARQLVQDQIHLAASVFLESPASDWSAPVEVAPPVEFFLVRANPGEGPLGLGTARVEVYRLFDGKWRLEEFSVAPGDRIGRLGDAGKAPRGGPPAIAAAPVDFTTDWFVVDIVEDQTGERRGVSDSQKPALVIIERLGDGQRLELREPARDVVNEQRRRLNRDWRLGAIG
jgi:hypothetical protein